VVLEERMERYWKKERCAIGRENGLPLEDIIRCYCIQREWSAIGRRNREQLEDIIEFYWERE
jgi:hypothetical protein